MGFVTRDINKSTLDELRGRFRSSQDKVVVGVPSEIEYRDASDEHGSMGVIAVKNKLGKEEVFPATQTTLQAIGTWLDIPTPFLARQDASVKRFLIESLAKKKGDDEFLFLGEDHYLFAIQSPDYERVDPVKVIDIAESILGTDAIVTDWEITHKSYFFEVLEPFDEGGEGLVRGLRFGQNTKQGLAPWVDALLYRPMTHSIAFGEIATMTLQLPGSVSISSEMDRWASSIDSYHNFTQPRNIHAIEELSSERVEDATQLLMRIGREGGLSSRVLYSAAEKLPAVIGRTYNVPVRDVADGLANASVWGDIWSKANIRRKVELAVGSFVADHSHRCDTCQSRVDRPISPEDLEVLE